MAPVEPGQRNGCGDGGSADPVLVVDDLTVRFVNRDAAVTAVDRVSFAIGRGETLGLVGESGSGKSLTCAAIMRVLPHRSARITGGSVRFAGVDLLELSERRMHEIRGRDISMILQDPMTSLNPLFTVGDQLTEAVATHRAISRRAARSQARELLERVQVTAPRDQPDARLRQYPHQLSGGQRQRVVGAMALAGAPRVIIADEPTTSLDVTVQAQYLRLLKGVQRDTGAALLLVTHDFGVVAATCDRVAVMYAGRIVESGDIHTIFGRPRHPYTQGLLASVTGKTVAGRLPSIPGQPPALGTLPPGCAFAARCPHVMDRCRTDEPPDVVVTSETGASSTSRCWLEVHDR